MLKVMFRPMNKNDKLTTLLKRKAMLLVTRGPAVSGHSISEISLAKPESPTAMAWTMNNTNLLTPIRVVEQEDPLAAASLDFDSALLVLHCPTLWTRYHRALA